MPRAAGSTDRIYRIAMKRILIADDEASIRDLVCRGLADCGYDTLQVSDGNEAWQQLQDGTIDLAILDIRMPGLSGVDLCRRLRQEYGYDLPIIMLTALGTTDDIVMGLRAGADDYMVKPFKFTELLARIEAQLRRSDLHPTASSRTYGDLHLDPVSHRATRDGKHIYLSIKEYRLLDYLMLHHGEVLSRGDLLRDVWDRDFDTSTNVVDVYVRYLRSKIDDPFTPLSGKATNSVTDETRTQNITHLQHHYHPAGSCVKRSVLFWYAALHLLTVLQLPRGESPCTGHGALWAR